jgi:uncharacterized protein with HEPN domain
VRPDPERVADILDAIARIERRMTEDFERFARDEMLQIWVVHHLEIVGEAAKHLSPGYRAGRPDIPWNEIIRMRDRLVHGYWDVDVRTTWSTVQRDLPMLRAALAGGSGRGGPAGAAGPRPRRRGRSGGLGAAPVRPRQARPPARGRRSAGGPAGPGVR